MRMRTRRRKSLRRRARLRVGDEGDAAAGEEASLVVDGAEDTARRLVARRRGLWAVPGIGSRG